MLRLILTLVVALPVTAIANSELNGDDTVPNLSDQYAARNQPPDPSARVVVIQFNKDGVPLAVAHSAKTKVQTAELEKLSFAQVVEASEEPNKLPNSTPSTENENTQGTPQVGYAGAGFRGGIYRGPNGGVIARGGFAGFRGGYGGNGGYRGYGGNGGYYGGGYSDGYYGGGYNSGGYYGDQAYYGGYDGYSDGWSTAWNPNWNGCGWGGCGCSYCQAPVYYYRGCYYRPTAFYGGGWGGNGGFYGMYQPY